MKSLLIFSEMKSTCALLLFLRIRVKVIPFVLQEMHHLSHTDSGWLAGHFSNNIYCIIRAKNRSRGPTNTPLALWLLSLHILLKPKITMMTFFKCFPIHCGFVDTFMKTVSVSSDISEFVILCFAAVCFLI